MIVYGVKLSPYVLKVLVALDMGWLDAGGLTIDAKRWPRVARYTETIRKHPSFVAAAAR